MKFWRYSALDIFLALFSIMQFIITLILATYWENFSSFGKITSFVGIMLMILYNIIVVSHLFTHTHWFMSDLLNRLMSMINTINIGQSVQIYQLKHVRNHHKFNNDQKGIDGRTNDFSSTFQEGIGNNHATLFQYAFLGAVSTFVNCGRELLTIKRLWKITPEDGLLELVANPKNKRKEELFQIQLDRMALLLGVCTFLFISWKWTLLCYLPALYFALAFVNVQNYYEHFGAKPDNKYANSVSYYGKYYNLFTFNDGYHQEHHLSYGAHWTLMPRVRQSNSEELGMTQRIVSPVPAILGFLHKDRIQLHAWHYKNMSFRGKQLQNGGNL